MLPRRWEYQITVVDAIGKWQHCTAPALVRDAGVPMAVAIRWAKVRREMSVSGLRKKLKDQVN